jgi:hypothetical protein
MTEKEFFDKVNVDKSKNIPLFNKDHLGGIHEKVINKLKGVNNSKTQPDLKISNPAQAVMKADMSLRNAVMELAESLEKLNDKEVGKQLIAEHIFILNEIFKKFE